MDRGEWEHPSLPHQGSTDRNGSERGPSPAPTAPPPGQHEFRDWGRGPTPPRTASTTLTEKGPGRGCGTAPSPQDSREPEPCVTFTGGAPGAPEAAVTLPGAGPAPQRRGPPGGAGTDRSPRAGRARPRQRPPPSGRPRRHPAHGATGVGRGLESHSPAETWLTFTVTGPPREGEARHRGEGGVRRPGRAASARSAPLGAPRALRPGAAPLSNTAPPAAARGPQPPHWPRRPARRAPIG